jgi:hypothetical protein
VRVRSRDQNLASEKAGKQKPRREKKEEKKERRKRSIWRKEEG